MKKSRGVEAILEAAEAGDTEAMTDLAQAYMYGEGFMMCAAMPCEWCEGSECGQATMMCLKWGLP